MAYYCNKMWSRLNIKINEYDILHCFDLSSETKAILVYNLNEAGMMFIRAYDHTLHTSTIIKGC